MPRVIVAGSRGFDSYNKVKSVLDRMEISEVVSGTARGADSLGEQYACDNNIPLKKFPADWSLGKRAGFIRNANMARYGDILVAFWDGKSKGTKDMINQANKYNLKTHVIRV